MKEDWIECTFEDLLDYEQPTKYIVRSTKYSDDFKTPVLTAGKSFIKGYTNETDGIFDILPTIIFDDFTTATQFVDFPFKVKSSAMKILVPKSKLVNMKYLFNCIQVNQVRNDTHKRYWISVYAKKKILLPPLVIQNAILSKTEEIFSDLDNGIANFKKAQEQLKTYRQAVLKKAFEGELTKEWREKIVKTDGNRTPVKTDGRPSQLPTNSDNLPKGWKWVKISDVCDMKAGYFIKADEINSEFENGLFPCYGGNGLRGYVKSTTHEGLFPIIGRQGALCGNVHLVNGKFHATEHAVVVTAKKEINIKCLYYKLTEMKINQYATGTAQPGLSVNKILPIEIIYPSSLEEQTQIVQEIESRLSVCDKMEQSLNKSIEKAEALRQSILKKAFEGRLLSEAEVNACKQAADYEPAGELLKKIKAEKLKSQGLSSQKKKKTSVKKKSKK
ncbi:MAG: restriction endonuclease subunit S [Bacteroidetes bacterium]|nr:restriction endonuclease subunit S [Bacteroidota bacterium]